MVGVFVLFCVIVGSDFVLVDEIFDVGWDVLIG